MLHTIGNFLHELICFIGGIYPKSNAVKAVIFSALGILTFHKNFYWVLGFFATRKFKETENKHKYAILIPARNEEAVIGNLIDSIKRQDYPSEYITIFVVADNCTDNTAKVARDMGAICYERFNDNERTKGYALKFLFQNIEKDYGIKNFEGYFIFDSDNLLNRDYITRMNEAFDAGEKIVTSYRNTKNFDENWVASTYALHWIRSIRQNHRARSVLRLATNIQGTGFLFANELVKDGWDYTSLTEDRAFTADAVAKGYAISYNDAAVFYDEQPISIRIALRQRTRWAKGHLLAFVETGWQLFSNIFVGKLFIDKSERIKEFNNGFLEGIRHRFASFDTLAQLVPRSLIKTIIWLINSVVIYACYNYAHGIGLDSTVTVFNANGNFLARGLNYIFGDLNVSVSPGVMAFVYSIALATLWNFLGKLAYDISQIKVAVYLFIVERKRIKRIAFWKKVLYCITWPTFDVIGRWAMYAALFMKVTWKPIPHTSKVTIEDIESK